MKPLLLMASAIVILTFLSPAVAEFIPDIKECEFVLLRTSQGWWIRINKDGSGSYGFGTIIDRIEIKQGVFNFKRVYEKTRKTSAEQRENSEESYVAVSYYSFGKSSAREYYIAHNAKWVKNLFLTAKKNTIPASNEIEKQWHDKINKLWEKSLPPFN
jgi:hypothetical protein